MANLDELKVRITGEISGFKKSLTGAASAAKSQMSKIQGTFSSARKGMNNAFDSVMKFRGALVGLAALGGLSSLAKNALNAADEIGKLSKNTGVSTKLIQELSFAASQTGVSQNDLNASLLRFNRRIADGAAGAAEFKKGFDALGVPLKNANGQLRSTEEILFDVADGVKELNSDNERASALFKVFGDSGFKLVNLFKNGSGELKSFAQQANELGIVIEEGMIENAEEANDQLDILQKVISAKFTKAVVEAAPAITDLANGLVSAIEVSAEAIRVFNHGAKSLANLAISAYATVTGNDALKESIKQVEQADLDAEYARQQGIKSTKESAQASKERKAALQAATKALEDRAKLEKDVAKIVETATNDKGTQIQKEIEMLKDAKRQRIGDAQEINNAIMAKEQELADFKAQKAQEEIARLMEKIEMLQEINAEENEAEIERMMDQIEKKKEVLGEFEQFKTEQRIAEIKDEQKRAKSMNEIDKWLQSEKGKNFESTMSFLQQGARSGNRTLQSIAKAAAIAQAGIDTYKAANVALGAAPPPLNFALAAAVTAVGLSNVSKIQSTPIAAQTGITNVPGSGRGDRVPFMLEPGERVVSREQNQDLKAFLGQQNQGGGTARVEIVMKDELVEFIEARIVERQRIGISVLRTGSA